MINIGFVDDELNSFEDYKIRLKRHDINLVFNDSCETFEDIKNWILFNGLKLVLIDYKLSLKFDFTGTELVYYLNNELPDLVCIILTSFINDSINENLVAQNLILDKKILNDDLTNLKLLFEQNASVFDNRLNRRKKEFESLITKKNNNELKKEEEDKFINLYNILRSYNEIDELPIEFLKTEAEKKIDKLLEALDKLLKE